ncbi:hypothetical protein ABT116_27170, partial [Streptomyces sp. NPDC002130]|uniref:hypothetical protein n=1 Tax=Streptomyces sp. NPDC002130 TaxID=3155568 RepID=UPI0033316206
MDSTTHHLPSDSTAVRVPGEKPNKPGAEHLRGRAELLFPHVAFDFAISAGPRHRLHEGPFHVGRRQHAVDLA